MPDDPTQTLDPTAAPIGAQASQQEAAPDFAQQFSDSILQQFLQNTPEQIEAKKRAEYYRNLGIKNPNGFWGRLGAAMNEAHLANKATKDNPYVPLNQRISDSAQAEYQKMGPQLRLDAAQVLKDRQEQAKVAQAQKAAEIKAETEKLKSQNTLTWHLDNVMAKQGDTAAKERVSQRKLDMEQKLNDQLDKIVPGYRGLPKNLQESVFINALSPEERQQYLETQDALSESKAPPSAQKAMFGMNDFKFGNYVNRDAQLQKNKALARPPGSQGSFSIFQGMGQSPSGDLVPQAFFYDRKNPMNGMSPLSVSPVDKKLIDTDRAFKLSQGNYQSAFSTMLDAIQSGEADKFQGPAEGNPLMAKFRALGFNGNGRTAPEATFNSVKNVADMLHTKALSGGGRFALQLAEKIAAGSGTGSDDPRSVARSLGALVFAVQDSRKMATDPNYAPQNITPNVEREIQRSIDAAVNQAYSNKALGRRSDIQMPTLDEILNKVKLQNILKKPNPSKDSFIKEMSR